MCSARKAQPAAPRATSIRRSNGCRSKSTGSGAGSLYVHLQRRCRCRSIRPAPSASMSPACATARGSRHSALHPTIGVHTPLDFRSCGPLDGAQSRRLPVSRYASGRAQLLDVAGQCLRSGKPPAWRASSAWATRRDIWTPALPRSIRNFPLLSICARARIRILDGAVFLFHELHSQARPLRRSLSTPMGRRAGTGSGLQGDSAHWPR